MTAIMHKIEMDASPATVFDALVTQAGLSAWWTDATAQPEIGSEAKFAFGPQGEHVVKMKVTELVPGGKVVWQCVEGPWEQTGLFEFDLEAIERGTALRFTHSDWPEADDFFRHCNSKWGFFLGTSLKDYVETGQGKPHPNDPAL